MTAYLDHPNIVPIRELASADDGRLLIAMRLIGGETSRDPLEAVGERAERLQVELDRLELLHLSREERQRSELGGEGER